MSDTCSPTKQPSDNLFASEVNGGQSAIKSAANASPEKPTTSRKLSTPSKQLSESKHAVPDMTAPKSECKSEHKEDSQELHSERKRSRPESMELPPLETTGTPKKIASVKKEEPEVSEGAKKDDPEPEEESNVKTPAKTPTKTPTKGKSSSKKPRTEKKPKKSTAKKSAKKEVSEELGSPATPKEKKTTSKKPKSEKKTNSVPPRRSDRKRGISKDDFAKYSNMLNTKKTRTNK